MWFRRDGWKWRHEDEFAFEYPRAWRLEPEDGYLHLFPSDAAIHLMVAAFRKPGGTLAEVVEAKLAAQDDVFPASGIRGDVVGANWTGIRHVAEDTRADREVDTRRIVLCAGHEDIVVTMSFYLDPNAADRSMETCERILNSLTFNV